MTIASEESADPLGEMIMNTLLCQLSHKQSNGLLLTLTHLDMAQEGCHGSLLCCDIFINEQEAEVNIVLMKATVDTNLEGTASQGEAQLSH